MTKDYCRGCKYWAPEGTTCQDIVMPHIEPIFDDENPDWIEVDRPEPVKGPKKRGRKRGSLGLAGYMAKEGTNAKNGRED